MSSDTATSQEVARNNNNNKKAAASASSSSSLSSESFNYNAEHQKKRSEKGKPHHCTTHPHFLQRILSYTKMTDVGVPVKLGHVSSSWDETIWHFETVHILWKRILHAPNNEILDDCIRSTKLKMNRVHYEQKNSYCFENGDLLISSCENNNNKSKNNNSIRKENTNENDDGNDDKNKEELAAADNSNPNLDNSGAVSQSSREEEEGYDDTDDDDSDDEDFSDDDYDDDSDVYYDDDSDDDDYYDSDDDHYDDDDSDDDDYDDDSSDDDFSDETEETDEDSDDFNDDDDNLEIKNWNHYEFKELRRELKLFRIAARQGKPDRIDARLKSCRADSCFVPTDSHGKDVRWRDDDSIGTISSDSDDEENEFFKSLGYESCSSTITSKNLKNSNNNTSLWKKPENNNTYTVSRPHQSKLKKVKKTTRRYCSECGGYHSDSHTVTVSENESGGPQYKKSLESWCPPFALLRRREMSARLFERLSKMKYGLGERILLEGFLADAFPDTRKYDANKIDNNRKNKNDDDENDNNIFKHIKHIKNNNDDDDDDQQEDMKLPPVMVGETSIFFANLEFQDFHFFDSRDRNNRFSSFSIIRAFYASLHSQEEVVCTPKNTSASDDSTSIAKTTMVLTAISTPQWLKPRNQNDDNETSVVNDDKKPTFKKLIEEQQNDFNISFQNRSRLPLVKALYEKLMSLERHPDFKVSRRVLQKRPNFISEFLISSLRDVHLCPIFTAVRNGCSIEVFEYLLDLLRSQNELVLVENSSSKKTINNNKSDRKTFVQEELTSADTFLSSLDGYFRKFKNEFKDERKYIEDLHHVNGYGSETILCAAAMSSNVEIFDHLVEKYECSPRWRLHEDYNINNNKFNRKQAVAEVELENLVSSCNSLLTCCLVKSNSAASRYNSAIDGSDAEIEEAMIMKAAGMVTSPSSSSSSSYAFSSPLVQHSQSSKWGSSNSRSSNNRRADPNNNSCDQKSTFATIAPPTTTRSTIRSEQRKRAMRQRVAQDYSFRMSYLRSFQRIRAQQAPTTIFHKVFDFAVNETNNNQKISRSSSGSIRHFKIKLIITKTWTEFLAIFFGRFSTPNPRLVPSAIALVNQERNRILSLLSPTMLMECAFEIESLALRRYLSLPSDQLVIDKVSAGGDETIIMERVDGWREEKKEVNQIFEVISRNLLGELRISLARNLGRDEKFEVFERPPINENPLWKLCKFGPYSSTDFLDVILMGNYSWDNLISKKYDDELGNNNYNNNNNNSSRWGGIKGEGACSLLHLFVLSVAKYHHSNFSEGEYSSESEKEWSKIAVVDPSFKKHSISRRNATRIINFLQHLLNYIKTTFGEAKLKLFLNARTEIGQNTALHLCGVKNLPEIAFILRHQFGADESLRNKEELLPVECRPAFFSKPVSQPFFDVLYRLPRIQISPILRMTALSHVSKNELYRDLICYKLKEKVFAATLGGRSSCSIPASIEELLMS